MEAQADNISSSVGFFNIEETLIANERIDLSFLQLTIPLGTLTILANLLVFKILWKEEKTPVNQLLMIHCLTNISGTILGMFRQSPFYTGLAFEVYCTGHISMELTLVTINRLVPVTIASYR